MSGHLFFPFETSSTSTDGGSIQLSLCLCKKVCIPNASNASIDQCTLSNTVWLFRCPSLAVCGVLVAVELGVVVACVSSTSKGGKSSSLCAVPEATNRVAEQLAAVHVHD